MDFENLIQPPNALLEQYLDYSRSERNLAETTLKAHREYAASGSINSRRYQGIMCSSQLAPLPKRLNWRKFQSFGYGLLHITQRLT